MTDPRLLILLNPGDVSRNYLLGIKAGADRAGIPATAVELGPVWHDTRAGNPNAAAAAADWYKRAYTLCRTEKITHVLSYVFNGVTSFGLAPDPAQGGRRSSPFTRAGCRHMLLWTDHPNWASSRAAFAPWMREALAHPLHTHLLKSRSAAEEAGVILDWPNCHGTPMAEQPGAFDSAPPPVTSTEPMHDAVVILSDATAVPAPLEPMLAADDPDPTDLSAAMIPEALDRFSAALARAGITGLDQTPFHELAHAWLALKIDRPLLSFWRLAERLPAGHRASLERLGADPALWYDAVGALQSVARWKRFFWIAWLGRRVNLGVYGSSSAALGLAQPDGAAAKVPYRDQARIYARGAVALNINAAHDEEGLTHKPFQIAAAHSACVHHDTLDLSRVFEPGEEVISFTRGPELLDAVRSLAADPRRRRSLADAMHNAWRRAHTWQHRLPQMLSATLDANNAPAREQQSAAKTRAIAA